MTRLGTSPLAAGPLPGDVGGPRSQMEECERVENYLHEYLDDGRFISRYPRAYERWSRAWAMLWRADSRAGLIAVAAEARAAMREFACALVAWREPHASLPDATDTLLRLWSLVEMCRPQLEEERCGLQRALFEYWDALCSAVQRQEDPAHIAYGPLRWEDARRVVVLTALVMVEIDRCL